MNMKTLVLVRHAKAVPFEPEQDDFSRPLMARGRKAAAWIGTMTGTEQPDLILCSSATRTRETWALIAHQWPVCPPTLFERGLYLADHPDLLGRLQAVPDSVKTLWLIGHNPGLHLLVRAIAHQDGHLAALPELDAALPTGGFVRFSLETDHWATLDTAKISMLHYVVPPKE